MDKLYEYVKSTFVNFKLDTCCFIASIRIGLLIIGYFNIFTSPIFGPNWMGHSHVSLAVTMIHTIGSKYRQSAIQKSLVIILLSLVGTADEGGYTPPLMAVQKFILDDDFSKPLGIVAYATEMAYNMLLLSGIYRNDIVLLRVYIYFVITSIISSILVYSIVFVRIAMFTRLLIIWDLVFQCYVIVLVRSAIVEIKETRTSEKNGHVTLYSVVRMPDEIPAKADEHPDHEITIEPDTSEKEEHQQNEEGLHPEQKKDEPPSKLETVIEHLKEN